MTRLEIFDKRSSLEIDSDLEPDLYLAKVAFDYYGWAIRDNSMDEIITLGKAIEAGEESND